MALLLFIETSASVCSVALSENGKIISIRETNEANKHAEMITVFCSAVMEESGYTFSQLDAVAVSKGPGSYTGLRIGVSAAKGICFALNKPLIAIGTLEAMANGMRKEATENDLLCPMIDARRMEVYCAVYDFDLKEVKTVAPLVLDESSCAALMKNQKNNSGKILFSGDGMPKAKTLLSEFPNAAFTTAGNVSAKNLGGLAEKKFAEKKFEDVAYFEPFYLKTFHPGPKRSAG